MPAPPPNQQLPKFNLSFGKLVTAVFLILLLGTAGTLFYQVPADSEVVVLRLGKPLPIKGPGLHWRLPWGIDQIRKVEVKRQKKLEFGIATEGATNQWQFSRDRGERELEKDMVTGDLNAVNVTWVVQYRITEPEKYLFNVRNPEPTLRDATESVMREVVGDRTVDEVLTVGRAGIEQQAFESLRELVSQYGMGIDITQIQLKDVNPPQALDDAFQDVNKAEQEKITKINQANREYLSTIPQARGKAERLVAEAEGYATERVNRAEGDAARFTALFEEYEKAPEVTKRRIYLETLEEVVPNLGTKVIMDEETSQLLPLLNLGGQK